MLTTNERARLKRTEQKMLMQLMNFYISNHFVSEKIFSICASSKIPESSKMSHFKNRKKLRRPPDKMWKCIMRSSTNLCFFFQICRCRATAFLSGAGKRYNRQFSESEFKSTALHDEWLFCRCSNVILIGK